MRLALGVALLIATVAHYLFWYAPRERAASPRPGDAPERLLLAESYDAALWLAYPHQNLGALAGAVEEPAALAMAAARLAGVAEPRLFSFGPFAAPPARELTLASDLDGGRFSIAARVYPTVAVLARLAGTLAGNPWLAGGELEEGGRRLRVAWDGTLWTVTAATTALPAVAEEPPGRSAGEAPALAVLRLGRSARGVPAGTYGLRRAGPGFVLAAAGRETPVLELELAGTDAVAVAFKSGGLPGEAEEPEAVEPAPPARPDLPPDLVLDRERRPEPEPEPAPPSQPEGDRAGLLFDSRRALVPRVAVLFEPGHKRWKLPAEGLLKIAGERFPEGEAGGWGLVAIDDYAYERAAPLAPRLAGLRDGRLAMGLWFRPAGTRPIVSQIAEVVAKVPLLNRRESRRWQDMALLLEALERFDRVVVEVGRDEGEARIVLAGAPLAPN